MQRLRRRGRTGWVAFAATIVLLVQSLLAGLAAGASAAPAAIDSYGNVICLSHPSDRSDHGEGDHGPDCCVMGCIPAAALGAPDPGLVGITLRPEPAAGAATPDQADPRPIGRRGVPSNPRAPPIAT